MANTVPIHALTLPQWGLETNTIPGTPSAAVAATKKMSVKDFLIRPTDVVHRDQILKGLAIANRGNEIITERGVDWEVPETPMNFNELHYWMGMAIIGPTLATATWTSTLNPAVVAARHLRTIELGLSSQTGGDNSDWEIPACFLTELELSGAANGPVMLRATGKGRRLQSSTRTGALALFTIAECPSSLTSVYFDAAWANRGTTQVTGQIIGWRWRLSTGLFGQQTMDGRSDQDYIVGLINPDELKWTLELDVKANLNTGLWQTQKTVAEAGTVQAVEVRGDNTASYQFKLQAMMKHTAGSVFPDGRENGEVTAKLVMEGSTDDTNALAMVVTNTTAVAIA